MHMHPAYPSERMKLTMAVCLEAMKLLTMVKVPGCRVDCGVYLLRYITEICARKIPFQGKVVNIRGSQINGTDALPCYVDKRKSNRIRLVNSLTVGVVR